MRQVPGHFLRFEESRKDGKQPQSHYLVMKKYNRQNLNVVVFTFWLWDKCKYKDSPLPPSLSLIPCLSLSHSLSLSLIPCLSLSFSVSLFLCSKLLLYKIWSNSFFFCWLCFFHVLSSFIMWSPDNSYVFCGKCGSTKHMFTYVFTDTKMNNTDIFT